MGSLLKVSWTRKYLQKMYVDKAIISRYTEEIDSDGAVKAVVDGVVAEYKCRVSFVNNDSRDASQEDVSPINFAVKLFFDVGVDIHKGDKIKALKIGENGEVLQVIEGIAALPAVYVNHVEVNLTQMGNS